jgi:hypothetical protein
MMMDIHLKSLSSCCWTHELVESKFCLMQSKLAQSKSDKLKTISASSFTIGCNPFCDISTLTPSNPFLVAVASLQRANAVERAADPLQTFVLSGGLPCRFHSGPKPSLGTHLGRNHQ